MPLSYHLIDGYNLLHAAGLARAHYGPGDLERSRFALVALIAEGLDESERQRTVIVFDASDAPVDAASRFHLRDMTVEFAPGNGDADAHIELLVKQHSSPRQLRVISDDNRLRKAAKRRGAQAVKCEAFLSRLRRRDGLNDVAIPHAHPKSNGKSGFADDWKSYFDLTDAEFQAPAAQIVSIEAPSRSKAELDSHRDSPDVGAAQPSKVADDSLEGDARSSPQISGMSEDADFWQARIDEIVKDVTSRNGRGTERH